MSPESLVCKLESDQGNRIPGFSASMEGMSRERPPVFSGNLKTRFFVASPLIPTWGERDCPMNQTRLSVCSPTHSGTVMGRRVNAVARRVRERALYTHADSNSLAPSSEATAQAVVPGHVYCGPGHRERAVMERLISLFLNAVGGELRLVVDGRQRVDADERVNGG